MSKRGRPLMTRDEIELRMTDAILANPNGMRWRAFPRLFTPCYRPLVEEFLLQWEKEGLIRITGAGRCGSAKMVCIVDMP